MPGLEAQGEDGLDVWIGVDMDGSAMLAHDLSCETQADSAPRRLRREERDKDFLQILRWNAQAVVDDLYHDAPPLIQQCV